MEPRDQLPSSAPIWFKSRGLIAQIFFPPSRSQYQLLQTAAAWIAGLWPSDQATGQRRADFSASVSKSGDVERWLLSKPKLKSVQIDGRIRRWMLICHKMASFLLDTDEHTGSWVTAAFIYCSGQCRPWMISFVCESQLIVEFTLLRWKKTLFLWFLSVLDPLEVHTLQFFFFFFGQSHNNAAAGYPLKGLGERWCHSFIVSNSWNVGHLGPPHPAEWMKTNPADLLAGFKGPHLWHW